MKKMSNYLLKLIGYFIIIISYLQLNSNSEPIASTCSTYCNNDDGLSCDNSGCPIECKPKYGVIGNCFYCPKFYYSLTYDTETSTYNCEDCKGNKILFDSKECINSNSDSFNHMYYMEDAFYTSCPEYSDSLGTHECKCLYGYYIMEIATTEIKIKQCLPQNYVPSGYKYYSIEDNQFFKESCQIGTHMKEEIIGGKPIIRCSLGCIGKEYQLLKESKKYCVDICPDGTKAYINEDNRECKDSCDGNKPYEKNNNCVSLDECTVKYENKCYDSCSDKGDSYYRKYGTKDCSECSELEFHYLNEDKKICYKKENCRFINEGNNKCLTSCNPGQGFYIDDSSSNKICYNACIEDKYYNTGTNKCISSCNGNKKFWKEGAFECFSSCKDIEDGSYIYIKAGTDGECTDNPCELYYTIKDGIRKCVADQEKCSGKNYNYIKGKECLEVCNGYQRMNSGGTAVTLIECFNTLNECLNSNYIYYNLEEKKCWKDLPNNYFINSKHNDKFEIVSICENYYYEDDDDHKNYCTNSCKEHNKYIDFNNEKKCTDKCHKASDLKNYYYDPRNYKCLESCLGTDYEFAYEPNNINHQECLINCPLGKFYYETTKLIKNNCDDGYYKSPNSNICVERCGPNERANDDKVCINECPTDFPFLGENNICYNSHQCLFINEEGNKCLSSCNIGEGFKEGGKCYTTCAHTVNNHYHNFDSNICLLSCTSDSNNKHYHLYGKFICYSSCSEIPRNLGNILYESDNICYDDITNIPSGNCVLYYEKEGGIRQCIPESDNECPDDYYYIKGKECLKECNGYKYNNEDATKQECLTDLNECFNHIPELLYYDIKEKICWKDKPRPESKYIKSINDNKYEFVNECENYYYQENENDPNSYNYCINKCSDKDELFIDFDNNKKCISKCKKNGGGEDKFYFYDNNKKCVVSCKEIEGLQFAENPTDDHKPCREFCPGGFYFDDNYIITQNCEYFISSSNSRYCTKKCESNEKFKIVGNDQKYCVKTCPKYKIKKIFTDLDSYEIEECVDNCEDYENYEGENFNFIDMTKKECIPESACNDGNKYYKVGNLCYTKCTTGNKYIVPSNNYICLERCPSDLSKFQLLLDTITDVYICQSSCDDGKFLLNNKCLGKCPSDINYIGNNNECKQTCKDDYLGPYYYKDTETSDTDNIFYKCITSCPLYRKEYECFDKCPGGFKFVKEDSNICLSECPEDYPFYEGHELTEESPHYICYRDSVLSCDDDQYILNGECKSADDCKDAHKIYMYENKICIKKCKENEYKQKNIVSSTADGTYTLLYKCLKSCDYPNVIIEDNNNELECTSLNCPKDKNYIGKDRKCKNKCEKEDGINYYKIDSSTSEGEEYNIYQCIDGCIGEFKYKVENRNECYNSCPDEYKYKSESESLCYNNCLNSKINPFTLSYSTSVGDSEDQFLCVNECSYDHEKHNKFLYGIDKVCRSDCSVLNTKIKNYNNECVSECDIKSDYKFNDSNECKVECSPETGLRYSKNNYICKQNCIPPENYLPEDGNECLSSCKSFEFKKKVYNDNDFTGEYRCVSSHLNLKYYSSDRILRDNCDKNPNDNDFVVENTNECVENCEENSIKSSNDKYYYYKGETAADTYQVNTCVLNCQTTNKQYLREDNVCSSSCDGNYKYHIENKFICLEDCPEGYIKKELTCVLKCQGDYKYYYKDELGEKCLKYCPQGEDENKYFVETDEVKKCLYDCPKESPFYAIESKTIDGQSINLYKCNGECNRYIVNLDKNINAKKCLGDSVCPTEASFSNENGNECYSRCPTGKFSLEEGSNKKCLDNCPSGYYYVKNTYKCLKPKDCPDKSIDYEKGLCVSDCGNKNEGNLIDGTENVKVCLDKCIAPFGKFETPDKKCVDDCTSYSLINDLIDDTNNGKCKCKNLFYYDSTLIMQCFSDNVLNCQQSTNDYKIELVGTLQCLKTCDNILSLNGEYCYTDASKACSHDPNSKVIGNKCDCPYKYQIINGKKKCWGENDKCHSNYYIPDTKECVNSCDSNSEYKFIFKNFCLKVCPYNSKIIGNNCKCGDDDTNFWFENSDGNFECLDGDCPDIYPVSSFPEKQCLKTCKGTYYPYLFENKCYINCESISIENLSELEITNNNLGLRTCICKYPWYFDNKVMKCPPPANNIQFCSDYTDKHFNYMVYETKECLEACPSNYLYNFNNECFNSCQNATLIYPYLTQIDSLYECKCENLWYYQVNHKKDICISKDIKECINFYDSDLNIRFEYEINRTKECVENLEKCPENSYTFNYICYDKCPENTIDNENNHECHCNKENGFWFEYEKNNRIYYKCGLDECKSANGDGEYTRMNLLESEKKCLISCNQGGDYKVALRNICIKECPEYTHENNRVPPDECLFYDLNDEAVVNDLESLKNYANIQAKELYEHEEANGGSHLGGFLFNKFDASLQIYAINKDNSLKKLSTKSNLTYIDFNTCLERLYEDNSLTDDDKIIVAKYDLLKWKTENIESNNENNDKDDIDDSKSRILQETNTDSTYKTKYLINPVEYELFNSRNNEKIDASVCEPNEIIVSYPISFNKNKYDDYESGFNNNEFKKRFEIGKELYNKNNEIDVFNSNNTVYKDLCTSVEINGKDLVLEDRYEFLYPNGALLCESNCTVNNTDFELERINCKCSYKEILDFNRKEESKNDLFNDPNFAKPTQSSANLEILKCLTKITVKQGIVNNKAFYYCVAVTLVEISMVFVTAFHGIKSISSNIINIVNKYNNNAIKFEAKNRIDNKKENIITTSNGKINNPPKKNNNDDDEKETEERNIITYKNLEINKNISEYEDNNKNDFYENNNTIILKDNISNKNVKAEYIPMEYNFKYFKLNDKGVIKKIERNKIPFEIDPDTIYLIERREGINYPENYLNGPYLQNQNILEIIDNNPNQTKRRTVEYERNKNIPKLNIQKTNDSLNTNKNNDINNKLSERKLINNETNINNNDKNEIYEEKQKEIINIRKIKPHSIKNDNNRINREYYKEENNENQKINVKEESENDLGLYSLIKREQTFIRNSYEKYLVKDHPNILAIFLAEILDKVYFVKICIFLKKFENFGINLSLYLFCHLLLLSLLCAFFTIKTIKKMWAEKYFPDIQFYLLYGFLSHIVIWIIYRTFLCLLDIQDKIKEIVKLKNGSKNKESNDNIILNENDEDIADNKFKELMKSMKIKIIIFYIIIFIFTFLCFIYLVSFFAIYTGTQNSVFKAYYISIIEILLIKFVYGIVLASLRTSSKGNELKWLYKVVYICDNYIS